MKFLNSICSGYLFLIVKCICLYDCCTAVHHLKCVTNTQKEKLGRRQNLCVHICERPAVLICYA